MPETAENAVVASPLLRSVEVTGLFGRYDYTLDFPAIERSGGKPSLHLMAGGNGTGKTTLLRLVYHVLSPANNRGHRSYLAKTKFESIRVALTDDTVFKIVRAKPTTGAFEVVVSHPASGTSATIAYDTDTDGDALAKDPPSDENEYLRILREVGLQVIYLDDNRRLHADADERAGPSHASMSRFYRAADVVNLGIATAPAPSAEMLQREVLHQSLTRVLRRIEERAFRAMARGETGTHEIYANVIRQLASAGRSEPRISLPDLVSRLRSLAVEADGFARYDLFPGLQIESIVTACENADADTAPRIARVLESYAETVEVRAQAVRPLYESVSGLERVLNQFLFDKNASISRKGVRFKTSGGETIDPADLSSGERHLTMLLCNLFVATGSGARSLFLIDEPEISMNPEWQRKLMPTLEEVARGGDVQLILATHSIQLLAHDDSAIVDVVPRPTVVG